MLEAQTFWVGFPLLLGLLSCTVFINDQCNLTALRCQLAEMPEWENWFEIAKQCKYLPENDLKVSPMNVFRIMSDVNRCYCFIEIVSNCLRFVDRRSQHPANMHSSNCLWGHPRTSMYCNIHMYMYMWIYIYNIYM